MLLPPRVMNILRSPLDEKEWAKLEEGEETVAGVFCLRKVLIGKYGTDHFASVITCMN